MSPPLHPKSSELGTRPLRKTTSATMAIDTPSKRLKKRGRPQFEEHEIVEELEEIPETQRSNERPTKKRRTGKKALDEELEPTRPRRSLQKRRESEPSMHRAVLSALTLNDIVDCAASQSEEPEEEIYTQSTEHVIASTPRVEPSQSSPAVRVRKKTSAALPLVKSHDVHAVGAPQVKAASKNMPKIRLQRTSLAEDHNVLNNNPSPDGFKHPSIRIPNHLIRLQPADSLRVRIPPSQDPPRVTVAPLISEDDKTSRQTTASSRSGLKSGQSSNEVSAHESNSSSGALGEDIGGRSGSSMSANDVVVKNVSSINRATSVSKQKQVTTDRKKTQLKTGPFSDEERMIVDTAFQDTRHTFSISEAELRQNIADWQSPRTQALTSRLTECLPDRSLPSIRRFCLRHFHTAARGLWTEEEEQVLQRAYAMNRDKWSVIAASVGRRAEDCRDRWRHISSRKNVVYGPWTVQEEQKLYDTVQDLLVTTREEGLPAPSHSVQNINWTFVSMNMGSTRSAKQCRMRYQVLQTRSSDGTISAKRKRTVTNTSRDAKAWEAAGRTTGTFAPGDMYDALLEIAKCVDDVRQDYADPMTIWAICTTKTKGSRFTTKLRRRVLDGFLEYRPELKALPVAEAAHTLCVEIRNKYRGTKMKRKYRLTRKPRRSSKHVVDTDSAEEEHKPTLNEPSCRADDPALDEDSMGNDHNDPASTIGYDSKDDMSAAVRHHDQGVHDAESLPEQTANHVESTEAEIDEASDSGDTDNIKHKSTTEHKQELSSNIDKQVASDHELTDADQGQSEASEIEDANLENTDADEDHSQTSELMDVNAQHEHKDVDEDQSEASEVEYASNQLGHTDTDGDQSEASEIENPNHQLEQELAASQMKTSTRSTVAWDFNRTAAQRRRLPHFATSSYRSASHGSGVEPDLSPHGPVYDETSSVSSDSDT